MKSVYIAGPYTNGDQVQNVRNAIIAAESIMSAGMVPFVPHLNMLWHMVSPHDHTTWLAWDAYWLAKCDAVLRLPGVSLGADREEEQAQTLGIPVFQSVEELVSWSLS